MGSKNKIVKSSIRI